MEPLVLIPGTLCTSALWEHQYRSFSADREVIIPDITRDASVKEMAERILNSVSGSFSLVGLSLGGIVAMEVMKEAPERVNKLALLDTNPYPPTKEQIELWNNQQKQVRAGGFEQMISEQFLPSAVFQEHAGEGVKAVIRQMSRDVGEEGYFRQLEVNKTRPGAVDALSAVNCPSLVLAGRQDALCGPSMQEDLAKKIPGAALVLIDQCGHLSPLDQPEAVTSVLSYWLQEN